MPYSIIDDIISLLPEAEIIRLTDDEGLGVVGAARVSAAIARADSEIDSYCGGRYAVPVIPVPDLLKKLSADIAAYNLYSRSVMVMPDVWGQRYRNAIRQLEGISRGIVSLGVPGPPASSGRVSGAETNKTVDGNVFSRNEMEGF